MLLPALLAILGFQNSAFAGCAQEIRFSCPKNATEFRILRDQVAHLFETQVALEIGKDRFLDDISAQFEGCLQDETFLKVLQENPSLQSCSQNLFSTLNLKFSFGSVLNPKDIKTLELPPELDDPEFAKLLITDDKNKNFEKTIQYINEKINAGKPEKQKWSAFSYHPRDLPFDPSMIITIPGEPERILHLEHRPEGDSFIAQMVIQKNIRGRSEIIATDHWATDGSVNSLKVDQTKKDPRFCAECHRMGLKPPMPVNLDPKYKQQYEAFLAKINSTPPIPFKGIQPMRFPGLGQKDALTDKRRNDSLFKQCASDIPPASWPKIKQAMNCTECHNTTAPDGMGTLGFPEGYRDNFAGYAALSATGAENFLASGKNPKFGETVISHILTGSMPQTDNDLNTTAERAALLRCLTTEYFKGNGDTPGIFPSWLKEGDCGVTPEVLAAEMLRRTNAGINTPSSGGVGRAVNGNLSNPPANPHQ